MPSNGEPSTAPQVAPVTIPVPRSAASGYGPSLQQIEDLEQVITRLAGFVLKATRLAERSTGERLAKLHDAVYGGQKLITRLSSDW